MGGRSRAHITDDLMIDILSRLPTKSLHRFGCVSKSWGSLISHARSQRRTLLPMSGLFFSTFGPVRGPSRRCYASTSGEQREREVDCTNFESRLRAMPCLSTSFLIHGCNGLFLFFRGDLAIYNYLVCNPATTECVALPERRRIQSYPRCFLAFNPSESPHYKVFRFSLEHERSIILEIYSSVTGDWIDQSLPHEPPLCFYRWMPRSVFLNGAFHMLQLPSHLVRFDITKGCFQMLSLPGVPPTAKLRTACIGKSRGHLYYAAVYYTNIDLKIWMLGGEGNAERWLLKHSMGTQIFADHPLTRDPAEDEPVHNLQILAFHPDSAVMYLGIPSKILSYHPGSGRLEEVYKIADPEGFVNWMTVFAVTPSLESIDPPGSKVPRW